MHPPETPWRECSSCRVPILHGARYYSCSVSTCNRSRMALYFCSLPCWEAHLPMMRHRDAWAEEQRAPSREQAERDECSQTLVSEPVPAVPNTRRVVSSPVETVEDQAESDDILVVVSKLKKYVRVRSGMNTSDTVIDPLSSYLRRLCDEAIRNAARDGRKTVMDRDFAPIFRALDLRRGSGS
jgi:histone H3/H4